jgi:hypothetical protein
MRHMAAVSVEVDSLLAHRDADQHLRRKRRVESRKDPFSGSRIGPAGYPSDCRLIPPFCGIVKPAHHGDGRPGSDFEGAGRKNSLPLR